MLTLVIGNKNYSSWSLRPWLVMKVAGLQFDEVRIPLSQPSSRESILQHSPNGKVPCLIDRRGAPNEPLRIWDSLAICEYVNETFAEGTLWPASARRRAQARSVTAEMHSGFALVRTHMSMDIRNRLPERGVQALARADVAAEVARIKEIWTTALAESGGPFLFGPFSIADGFFAPVVTRFATYAVPLSDELGRYSRSVLELPAMREWTAAAQAETEVIQY